MLEATDSQKWGSIETLFFKETSSSFMFFFSSDKEKRFKILWISLRNDTQIKIYPKHEN